jgi:putative hydroxymethylpyrimidine transport system permease protein
MRWLRPLIIAAVLLLLWQIVVWVTQVQPFILPGPVSVLITLVTRVDVILGHAWITGLEVILGLALGTILGVVTALLMAGIKGATRWLMPVLVASQAIPVFAIAPLLVLWLDYGMTSKVAMATLIIYFPVTAAFFDGLRRTEPEWLALAETMGASRLSILRHIRMPAAMPSFASGLRVAASVAPIGAVVGEWVGSEGGLGYLMLHANARMQIDLMFAALFVLTLGSVTLYFTLDWALKRLIPWQPETLK